MFGEHWCASWCWSSSSRQRSNHVKRYSKPEWRSIQSRSPITQSNRLGERAQPSATYPQLTPCSGDPKHSKAWQWPFYCSFEVEGVVIFVDNSQEAQLIQPPVVAFFRVGIVYSAVATSSQPPAVLLWPIRCGFHFLHTYRAKSEIRIWLVDSRAIWDKFAQSVYSLTIHTLNTYMITNKTPLQQSQVNVTTMFPAVTKTSWSIWYYLPSNTCTLNSYISHWFTTRL